METPRNNLILSIFPGIDLFGRAFENKGFCVVRGPDLITGGDIRHFHPTPGKFDGVIGGPPCTDFSKLRRCPPTGNGIEMLAEFKRVVETAQPEWSVLENVPGVPDVKIAGYARQRIDIRGTECGLEIRRIRHFQFYSRCRRPLAVPRIDCPGRKTEAPTASYAERGGRATFDDFCKKMGLNTAPNLPAFHRYAKYRAVGNGVPIPMGELLAEAISRWTQQKGCTAVCRCGCGRPIRGQERTAGPACRKRLERIRRKADTELEAMTPLLFNPRNAGDALHLDQQQ